MSKAYLSKHKSVFMNKYQLKDTNKLKISLQDKDKMDNMMKKSKKIKRSLQENHKRVKLKEIQLLKNSMKLHKNLIIKSIRIAFN